MKEQKSEIVAIKEHDIKIKLSNDEWESITDKAGCANMTVGELISKFIGDLVSEDYSNDSVERDMARGWYDCYYSPNKTFLSFIVDECGVENYEALNGRDD